LARVKKDILRGQEIKETSARIYEIHLQLNETELAQETLKEIDVANELLQALERSEETMKNTSIELQTAIHLLENHIKTLEPDNKA
jgi:hypothetical protein